MRKITRDAINAFLAGSNFSRDNTEVKKVYFTTQQEKYKTTTSVVGLCLHGNIIATINLSKGQIHITNAGWPTATTKERLNGIPGVNIRQKDGVWYLNNEEWDGGWITL